MAFMDMQTTFGRWYLVETNQGVEIIPAYVCGLLGVGVGEDRTEGDCTPEEWTDIVDSVRVFCMGEVLEVSCVEKWGCRYSAPGYLDCTDWVLGDTEEKVVKECRSIYGEEDEEDNGDDEA